MMYNEVANVCRYCWTVPLVFPSGPASLRGLDGAVAAPDSISIQERHQPRRRKAV